MASVVFESHQARIFFHSGRTEEQIRGESKGSYWLICEARTHHGFNYWGIIARLNSLSQLQKLNGENA